MRIDDCLDGGGSWDYANPGSTSRPGTRPLSFRPERWTEEFEAGLPKLAYFPFGGGPRICIGMGFAWMEGILLLATLGRRWKMRLVPRRPVEPSARTTLRPRAAFGLL